MNTVSITHQNNNHILLVYLYVLSTLYVIFSPFLKKYTYLDELIVIALVIYSINYSYIYKRMEVFVIFAILVVYLVYSIIKGVNKSQAALYDFILFLKPFACFIVTQQLRVTIRKVDRKRIKLFYLVVGIYCMSIIPFVDALYTNPAGYYPACILCAVSYLYFSNNKKKDWIMALILLSPGLLTLKAKFYTEFLSFIFIVFFLKEKIKFKIKWIIIISLLIVISVVLNWEKFYQYFIIGADEEVARSLFYEVGIQLLQDYFPFGSGFGTFATEAAAKYYSPLYHEYGLDSVWGLQQQDYGGTGHDFLKDTFYPALAQFGFVGVILYVVFWSRIWIQGMSLNFNFYKILLFIFFVELIQNLADNSFTGSFGIPLMMMLGLLLNTNNSNTNGVRKSMNNSIVKV